MSEIVTVTTSVTTTGTSGAATGTATTPSMMGFLLDVYLNYHASAPNTTDVTIAYQQNGGNVLVVSNSSTDARLAPRQSLVTNANAAITNGEDRFPLSGPLTITLAECDALTGAVVVTFRYLRG